MPDSPDAGPHFAQPRVQAQAPFCRTALKTVLSYIMVPAALYAISVSYYLAYFYRRGAALYDPGWFAWLSRNGIAWPLPNPALIGGSFLAIHVSPIFFLTSALSGLIPGAPYAIWFCLWFSAWLPLLWLALFSLTGGIPGLSVSRRTIMASVLSLNGITFSMVGFPHIESFIPPLLFGTVVACLRRKRYGFIVACLAFAVALAVREDAGLHAALAFASLAMIMPIRRGAFSLLSLAAVGVAYSLAVLVAQHLLFTHGGASLGGVYLGHPMFSTVTLRLLAHRLVYWATARSYVFVPLGLLLFIAARARDWQLGLGVLIAMPWTALSLIAVSPLAGELYGYYAFPLMIPCFWPMLVASISPEADPRRLQRLLALQASMGVASCVCFILIGVFPGMGNGGGYDRAPWLHLRPPSIGEIARTETALHGLEAAPGFETAILDDGVASLTLGHTRPGQFSIGLDPKGLALRNAQEFVRFNNPLPYVTAEEVRLTRLFPVCSRIDGTSLEVCRRGAWQAGASQAEITQAQQGQ
ncbi:MAG TPA: hypothetical protein VL356_12305 [Acidocella sp.]|nr:hypothetical protein [Acidocella sp.]